MKMSLSDDLLFVSNMGQSTVSIINTTLNAPIGEVSTTGGVIAVKAVPEADKLYVAEFESGGINVYNLTTKEFIRTIELPHPTLDLTPSPTDTAKVPVVLLTGGWSLDYNPNNFKLYVANYNANEIAVIYTGSDSVIQTIPVPHHPYSVRVDPPSDTVLVTSIAGNRLSFISSLTDKISGSLETGTMPWGLDIDSSRHLAYVTNRGNYYITVVDFLAKQIVAKIPVTAPAEAITIDPSENKIYVGFTNENNIVKINGNTNQIESVIEMDGVPIDLAVNPKNHNVYAAMKFQDKVFVIGPKSMSATLHVVKANTPTAVTGIIRVHGHDTEVSEPYIDSQNKTLIMNVRSLDGGDLTLNIPRYILDSKKNATDTSFTLLIDERPTEFQETTRVGYRELTMFIPMDSKIIKIIGTTAPLAEQLD
jgi:YVTN family beta-propeller protein